MLSEKEKKAFRWITIIATVMLVAALVWWWYTSTIPTRVQSVSPDGIYIIDIGWNKKRQSLLHTPPVDVELQGHLLNSNTKLFTLFSTINNESGDARMDDDIRIFWEDNSRATVLLLGQRQIPEVITIDFAADSERGLEITRKRSYDTARGIFLTQRIPLNELCGCLAHFDSTDAIMEYDFLTTNEVSQALNQLIHMERNQQISENTYQCVKDYLDGKQEELRER